MGYFASNKHTFFGDTSFFEHKAAYGTANSTSKEKGTDNKLNNTSEYNHKYYEENKEKWSDNDSSSNKKKANMSDDDDLYYDKDGKARFGHKDYDENDPDFKRTDGQKIEGTELRTFTNSNGSTIIMGKGIKFSFPPGTKITSSMAKKLADIEKSNDGSNKESYIAKMLNAVTGFADKQKLNTDTAGKGKKKKKSSNSSGEQANTSNTSDGKKEVKTYQEKHDEYYSKKKK